MQVLKTLQQKRSPRAIFLGCGPSINRIDDAFIEKLRKLDVWSSNNFLIHDIIPDFHHLEIKPERNGKLFENLHKIKPYEFTNTTWLLNEAQPFLLDYLHEAWKNNVYLYQRFRRETDDGFYTPHKNNRVALSCTSKVNANLTAILDMMYKVGYERIYFLGVDLYSSKYFWTDNPKYDQYEMSKILYAEMAGKSPDSLHSTHKTARFVREFSRHNNLEVINLSASSLLKEYIKTIDIEKMEG